MTETEFRRANDRRMELLNQQCSGFTEAECRLRLDLDPEWAAEFEARIQANLSDAERAELAGLQEACGEWVDQRYPLPGAEELRGLVQARGRAAEGE